jgi:hypothetical protein
MKQTAVEWIVNEIQTKYDKSFVEFYGAEIEQAKEIEKQQQDEFAIGFLDFAKNETDYDSWDSKFDYKGVLYTSKELLEIYKKEKGL